MTTTDRSSTLADEQALNRDYMRYLESKVATVVPVGRARSAAWTGSQQTRVPTPEVAPLVGRVGLAGVYDAIDSDDFYIGPWFCPSMRVYSWVAPIAAAYYGTDDHDGLRDAVVITRAFRTKGSQVVDFADERQRDEPVETPFDRRRQLTIRRPPRRGLAAPEPEQWRPPQPTGPPPATQSPPAVAAPPPRAAGPGKPVLRHRDAVLQAVAAPRGVGLGHVLSTLQPDQYRLITRPATQALVVQGHPGSGKTIVALHRAAYLVDRDGGSQAALNRVLVLGPTAEFVAHARPVVSELRLQDRVFLSSMPRLLRYLLPDLAEHPDPGNESYRDYDDELKAAVDVVAGDLRARGLLDADVPLAERTRRIYDTVRQGRPADWPAEVDSGWTPYLRSLPAWKQALALERLHPLLAYCSLVARTSGPQPYEHIVVDEAQDVRPLEWHLLKALNVGTWTLVGDMNQRRSDACLGSWNLVQRAVGIAPAVATDEFSAVYRSTAAILAFANALLPAAQRRGNAVQEDELRPDVRKVSKDQLASALATTLDDLAARHPTGTLAVITPDPSAVRGALVKGGWQVRRKGETTWHKGTGTLRLLAPQSARGLEFDAVVVLEPAAFPMNLGRYGVLYTSLTRANRELAVLHTEPLPEPLRRVHARRSGA